MLSLIRPMARSTQRYAKLLVRGAGACAQKKQNPGLAKIRQMQMKFQQDDGKPVFLKGGMSDMILYRATWVLAFIGLLLNFKLYFGYILF